ncbi:hypothetical protein F5X99DRAFT_118573 [Biscogniauxia marginata]|nr:hypothetical protein F5X99DRAFT_118573 [Biscogniauxia marginata]
MLLDIPISYSEAMSNSATFSYAQAAKGQSTTATQPAGSQPPSSTNSQAPSTTSIQNRDAPTTSTRASSVAASAISNDINTCQNSTSSFVKPDSSVLSNNDTDTKSTTDEAAPSHSTAESLSSAKLEGEKPSSETSTRSVERRGRGQSIASHVADTADNKKPRKGKKSKSSDKDSDADQDRDKKENVPPKPELFEAPPPSVNIWVKRKEEQAAKNKTGPSPASQLPSSTPAGTGPLGNNPATVSSDLKQKPIPNDGTGASTLHNRSLSNGAKALKKDGDQPRSNGNQGPRRGAPRGTRAQEKEDRATFEPLTSNAASWPTPETAASGLKALSQAEKPEKEEKDDSGPNKPRQKEKWVTVPINPTVKWETPIPVRSSRGGRTGGGARGGRDIPAAAGQTTTTTAGKRLRQSELGLVTNYHRERHQDIGPGSRAALPTKRASVDAPTSREPRKHTAQAETSKVSREPSLENTKVAPKHGQADQANGVISSQQSAARLNGPNQRIDDGAKSSDFQKDAKAQNAKEANYHGQNGGNHRPTDRGRGGGRGRGGYSTNGLPHTQATYAQSPSSYHFPSNPSPRQSSHPYGHGYSQMPLNGPYPGQSTGGHSRKSGSMSGRPQPHGRHTNGRVASMPPVTVPFDATVYPANPYFDPTANLYHLVLSQLEYYFSIDNLCKDWFLRTHMDSQGFVPLNFIASFNRMKHLTFDMDILRAACEDSSTVDIVVGNDGQERVRRKNGWRQWVIENMEKRDISARHDGPTSFHLYTRYHHAMMPSSYQVENAPVFSPTGADPNFVHYTNGNHLTQPMTNGVNGANGVNGYVPPTESQLSATVPEFSPATNSGDARRANGVAYSHSLDLANSLLNGSGNSVGEGLQNQQVLTNGMSSEHGNEAN